MSKMSRRNRRRNAAKNAAATTAAIVTPTIEEPTMPKVHVPYAKTAKRDAKGRLLPKTSVIQQVLESDKPEPVVMEAPTIGAFDIYVLKGNEWKLRMPNLSHTPKGRALKNENDALRFGYGIYGSRPRLGEATSKGSGKRFKAVKAGTTIA